MQLITDALWISTSFAPNCTLISAFLIACMYVCSLNFLYNILLVPSLINELNNIFDTSKEITSGHHP